MDYIFAIIFIAIVSIIIYRSYRSSVISKRENLIDTFVFPKSISGKIIDKYPHLDEMAASQVIAGLKEYFHLCNIANRKMVSMPSQAVDVAWHEFILFTKQYEHFCQKALGRFLHHTPAEAMQSPTMAQAGIKTAWKISCFREDIQPNSAYKLPLLFSIDTVLNIPDGFKYSLNCKTRGNSDYCAGHIGCGSGCGGGSDGCGGGCGGD